MSNGDSLDDFVFPPFVPTASTRPAQAPPAAPPPAEPEPPAPVSGGPRMAMPWDAETPIVRSDDAAPAPPAGASAEEEDLPWLEVPTPREAAAPTDEAAPASAAGATLPDWMTWDQRDEMAAEAEARDTVSPIAGLEDFIPVDDLAGAPPPSVEWAEAQPDAGGGPPSFDGAAPPDGFPELSFDAPGGDEAAAAEQASSPDEWSLATPEAAEPPAMDEAPLPSFEESPAAAEPSYQVSVDEADSGALVVEHAAEPQPFVADEEAVMAAEPDPFTAASVADAESASPAEAAGAPSPFDDVASRLEEIARMLRHRPDELLAGGSPDPLALLVTGYVMGYTARR